MPQSAGVAHSLNSIIQAVRARWVSPPAPRPLWDSAKGKRPQKILLIAWFDPKGLSTILENIQMIGQMSRFRFDLLNLYGLDCSKGLELPHKTRLDRYDGIFIHCTLAYGVPNLLSLDRRMTQKIADYPGLKIMMKQDENVRTNEIIEYLSSRRFDLLLTCVPPQSVAKVYPPSKLPGLHFLHTLTGYVSDHMRQLPFTQQGDRPIDIGYRGSIQPFWFGRLSYEKLAIGEAMREVCTRRGLACDISSRWEDRFMGEAWFGFLGRIKAVLGVESGASIFDFDGQIETRCKEYLSTHVGATFKEVFDALLAPHEGNVYYNQVSPRHFEAAACRTVQILYEGKYSDILIPGRHYLSLGRDLANVDEVLQTLGDRARRVQITEQAHAEIICNDRYHYRSFVNSLDDEIESLLASKSTS